MLARREIPPEYLDWNKSVGSPFGYSIPLAKKIKRLLPKTWYWRWRGPFSIQKNSTTREFEYPFAFNRVAASPKQWILDIGGGLSGFQFVLSKKGCRVVNVDPGMDAKGKGWPCTPKSMAQLNQIFNTDVVLYNTTVDNANIPANSLDAAVSISVIEHLPRTEVISVMNCVWDFLKPGGIFVLTVDLFLNIYPFCAEKTNKYGSNINLAELAGVKPFKIVLGDTRELFGFPDFDANSILNQKDKYLIGRGYPAMVQCLVLEKPIR